MSSKMIKQYGPLKLHTSFYPLGLLMLPVQACFKVGLVDYLFPNFAIRVAVVGKDLRTPGIKVSCDWNSLTTLLGNESSP